MELVSREKIVVNAVIGILFTSLQCCLHRIVSAINRQTRTMQGSLSNNMILITRIVEAYLIMHWVAAIFCRVSR